MELELNLLEQGQNLIRHGGIFIWCIVAVSIAALVISLERFWMLQIKYRLNGRKLFDNVKHHLIEGNIREAEVACENHAGIPLAQMLRSGISAAARKGHQGQLDIAIESEILNYLPMISQRLNYLPSLANVATLFGLLGTIAGLIVAFKSTGGVAVGGMNAEQGLAAGIAVAMYNTALGLMVAIPTTLSYLYLSNRANATMDDLERYASAFKRLVFELGLIEERQPAVHGFDKETVFEPFKVKERIKSDVKVAEAQDRLEKAQREVALEAKTPSSSIPAPVKAVKVQAPEKRPEASAPKESSKRIKAEEKNSEFQFQDEKTVILEADSRISVTQAVKANEILKPFSEETEKLFASAVNDKPAVSKESAKAREAERFAMEKTKISTRGVGLEDITDELTTPEMPGVRKP